MAANMVEVKSVFRVMNTDVQIILCVMQGMKKTAERVLKKTELLFRQAEATMSRFNADSELTRLNASSGAPFKASPRLFEVVAESLEAARTTGGVFDPTILSRLAASGYDRSFETIGGHTDSSGLNNPGINCRWQDILLDARSSSVYLPQGCSIDLGGIGKGWTVDMACIALGEFANFAVDAGGDIRVRGTRADGSPWDIGVADPLVPGSNITAVKLNDGAICTSTTTRRKWQSGGETKHHLIDPRSGKPSCSGVISATVIADSATRAEVIAKTALILGPEAGRQFIESQTGAFGLLVLEDKQLVYSTGFKEHAHAA
jgi:FAD:protein FMN transferase